MMVGNQAAIADPDQPAVLMFSATGALTRRIVLPVRPRPFDPKAVREARERAAPVVLGEQQARSPARSARMCRAVAAVERWLGRILPRSRWAYFRATLHVSPNA
jgi:hypothetical protein